jgi:hypothetical protein
LGQHGQPMSLRQLLERIRQRGPEFKQVADFDVRSAVLAMTAIGTIESSPTNKIAVRVESPVAARG